MSRFTKYNRVMIIVSACILFGLSSIYAIAVTVLIPKNPVFYRHYEEVMMPSEKSGMLLEYEFYLKYLTKAKDTRTIESITFEEAKELGVNISNNSQMGFFWFTSSSDHSGQLVKEEKIRLEIDSTTIKDLTKPILLENANITLSDGTTYRTNVGKILLYPFEDFSKEMESNYSYSNGLSEKGYTVTLNEPVTVTKVGIRMAEDLPEYQFLYNGIRVYGEGEFRDPYEKNEKFDIIFKRNSKMQHYDYYQVAPYVQYENESGNVGYYHVCPMQMEKSYQTFLEKMIYLYKRGGVEHGI